MRILYACLYNLTCQTSPTLATACHQSPCSLHTLAAMTYPIIDQEFPPTIVLATNLSHLFQGSAQMSFRPWFFTPLPNETKWASFIPPPVVPYSLIMSPLPDFQRPGTCSFTLLVHKRTKRTKNSAQNVHSS